MQWIYNMVIHGLFIYIVNKTPISQDDFGIKKIRPSDNTLYSKA